MSNWQRGELTNWGKAGLPVGHFQVLCTLKALLLLLLLPGRFNKVSAAQTLIPFIKKLFICQFLPFSSHYAVMLPIVVLIAKFHSASRSNSSRSISCFQWHPFRIFLALFLVISSFFWVKNRGEKIKIWLLTAAVHHQSHNEVAAAAKHSQLG